MWAIQLCTNKISQHYWTVCQIRFLCWLKGGAEKRRGKAEKGSWQLSIFMFVATSDDICRLTFLNLESWTCFCGQDAKSLRIKTSLLAVNLVSCVIGTLLFFHHNKYCMSGGRLLSDSVTYLLYTLCLKKGYHPTTSNNFNNSCLTPVIFGTWVNMLSEGVLIDHLSCLLHANCLGKL